MSELTDAFEEMLDSAEEVKEERETVNFRGLDIDALFGSENIDIHPGPGGSSDGEPIEISCRLSDIDPLPEPLEPITIRGRSIFILSYKRREGRVDLICGDPSEELNES